MSKPFSYLALPLQTLTTDETFDRLESKLATRRKVFYTRFGDGDIHLLMGKSYRNHEFSEQLRTEMEESFLLEDADYLRASCVDYEHEAGMKHGLFTMYPDNDEMSRFLMSEYPQLEHTAFDNHNTLPYFCLLRTVRFVNFLEHHVRQKKKLFVGGVDATIAERLFGTVHEYVRTPMRNAYAEIDRWWPEVMAKAQNVDLVIPTAGAASKIINKRLWQEGYDGASIDIGAIIDWVDGRLSRKWIKLLGHRINASMLDQYQNKSLSFRTEYLAREVFYHLRNGWKDLRNFLR